MDECTHVLLLGYLGNVMILEYLFQKTDRKGDF